MIQTKVDALLTHVRIRRDVLFRLYYFPKRPWATSNPNQGFMLWGELIAIDNHVLMPAADAGLIPKDWHVQVPVSETDNGGFDPEYLAEYLA